MIARIALKELLEHLLSLRFAAASVLIVVATLVSFGLSGARYERAAAQHGANVAAHEREVLQGESLGAWSGLAWRGVRVDKPLNPMALFDRLPAAGYVTTVSVNAYYEPELVPDPDLADRLFGILDLETLVMAVLSLLAIVFSYDALSGEKQRGTLHLVMSYPVSRGALIVGKWLGAYLCLLAPFLMALLAGCLMLGAGFGLGLDATTWVCLGLMVAVSFLYLGAVLSLGLWLSASCERPTTAIVVLLAIWAGQVLLVPVLAPQAAAWLAPVTGLGELAADRQAAQRDLEARSRAARARRPVESFDSWLYYAAAMDEMRGDQVVEQVRLEEQINERFRNHMRRQVVWAENLSRISPAATYQLAVSRLAANGPDESIRFWQALMSYRQELTRYAFYSWGAMTRENAERRKVGLPVRDTFEIEDYPRFSYRYPDAGSRLGSALVDILLLCLWNGVLFFAAYVTFLRSDLR